jgi:hypothetical protein
MQVHARLPALATRPPTQAEKEVAACFVHRAHVHAIAIATDVAKIAISFRVAGEATLLGIEDGKACKGTRVKAKTIKKTSLQGYGSYSAQMLADVRAAGIEGCVGHWGEKDRLQGLYICPEAFKSLSGRDKEHLGPRLRPTPDGKHRYYPIDSDLQKSLRGLKEVDG